MTNDDTASNHDYSGGLSDEIYRLVKRLRGRYRGTFVFNQLGEHLLFADAFTRLAEPHLPQPLKQDARLIRSRIDFELRNTLAVCILSLEDVTGGPPMDETQQQHALTSEQAERVWNSHFTSHFSDILCDTQFWYIVDALRKDIGLDAPPIA